MTTDKEDIIRSTISKKKTNKDDDAESHGSAALYLDKADQRIFIINLAKKLKKIPKSG